MSCCGNSLFNKNDNNRKIKFICDASGASLVVTNGATVVSKIDMCSFSKSYGQYNQTQMYLESGALNREVPFNIGTQVNFLFLKVQYVPKQAISSFTPFLGTNEVPYLEYTFFTNPNEKRYLDDIMMLTGDDNHKLPKIYLSNPNNAYDANITILTSTNSITYVNPEATTIGDNVITVEKLVYNNITSDCNNLYVNSTSGTVVTMRWEDITFSSTSGDLELNGKIITISDYVKGTINLSFVDEYNAKQTYSAIKWALCNRCVNLITSSITVDNTPPTINYSPNFTTEIVLNNFPPLISSTCGTSGTDFCEYLYEGSNGGNVILKNDLFKYLVVDATDDRDCSVIFTSNNLTIRPISSSNYIDAITELGFYQLTFDVKDNAGNLTTDSFILNVKDVSAPELIVSTLGLELINTDFTTSGLVYIQPDSYINIPSYTNDMKIKFDGSDGQYCYLVFENLVIEVGSYINSTIQYFVFDANNVSSRIEWDTTTELGVTKQYIINSKIYDITWIGFGSLLFSINYTNMSGTNSLNNPILCYSGTNFMNSSQISDIYLEDFSNKKITKQILLDLLLSEIWDERDGVILRHTNNVLVDITRLSDNILINEIVEEGYYSIKMSCEDVDNNLGTYFWENRNTELNVDNITILVRENKSPAIFINDIKVFKLIDYIDSKITRNDLNNQLVYKVIDDRDGIILTDILNVRIFQIGEESTSGTNGTNWFYPTYTEGSSGLGVVLQYVEPTEILYIDSIGEYEIQIRVQDSDNTISVASFIIDVFTT